MRRSLYLRILIASLVTVVMSLGAFIVISDRVVGRRIRKFVDASYSVHVSEAIGAYQRGGPTELASLLARLDAGFDLTHHLADAGGRDVITGEDYGALISKAGSGNAPVVQDGTFVFVRSSPDGRFRLIARGPAPFSLWSLAPFYLVVLGSIGLISWWLARSIVPPIRAVTGTAERFGRGDLTARVTHAPAHEVGRLAASFNGMADRIETLLQAERRLLQDVSHELRSPLARLNFSAELARTAPDAGAAIDRIQVDLDRLAVLVDELIEMSRAEGDPATRRVQPVDLARLLADIEATTARDAEERGVRVVVTGYVSRPLLGDPELLRRGIENVVRNGVRYAPTGTAVTVHQAEGGGEISIAVQDEGPGVPEPQLTRIFEPFYRVEESRDATTGGVGLGLAIARRAIQLHQGTITAVNTRPGLRVRIALPHS